MAQQLGLAGALAKKFLQSEITPLLALVGVLMGLFAVLVTPREEEPQIEVTFANVFVAFPGASALEVEHLVSTPGEQVLAEIEGVKHVYSVSSPGMAVLTVEFEVGESRTQSIVRLYNQIFSNQDWLPANLGVAQPIVKPMGIDDVPIVSLTLWSDQANSAGYELQKVAHALEAELKRVPGTRDIYTVGAPDDVVHVLFDPQRLAAFNIGIDDLRRSLQAANVAADAGAMVRDNREITVRAGTFLSRSDEVAALVIGVGESGPVFLSDVADVTRGAPHPERSLWFGTGPAAAQKGIAQQGEFPAVTVAVAKKPGTNAVAIAQHVIDRVEQLKGIVIPEGVQVTVTRNYGATANDKARTLITKLLFATASVVVLVLVAVGRREAVIVGTAVVITLLITLFASWAWGFTINRVSLFALIFSIGILVDDAIVVVENIHRHMQIGGKPLVEAIPLAVDEVGGPTILATFTVIAALLPMAFVTGLMGPYMSPIPINASMGMFISLLVAFVVTPWLALKLFARHAAAHAADHAHEPKLALYPLFSRTVGPFLAGTRGRVLRWLMLLGVLILIGAAVVLPVAKLVVLKMLPFDNKSEFQVIVDMPEGTSLQQTQRVLAELGRHLATVPEVTDYQVYAGTASPINFNGLVRQYYLRRGAQAGDIQVNLVHRSQRHRKSHEIALAVREPLQAIGKAHGANVKIVEVPPGPPVMSPLVAEVYGIDPEGQIAMAKRIRAVLEDTPDVVDVDDSIDELAPRYLVAVDRERAAHLGVSQASIVTAIATAMGGEDVSFLRDASRKYAVPLRLELPMANKRDVAAFADLKVRAGNGALVAIGELVTVTESTRERAIYHKDLLPVVFVVGDVAGKVDSPLYGMFSAYAALDEGAAGEAVDQHLIQQPPNPYRYSLKWDGEWQVTYDTFRDMGIAYAVGLVLIYLLVVAQFRSYLIPLIIMAPIPLTIIGVMPGHALLGAPFTATSMIGMIALAGIIVRNSILLVDFINVEARAGAAFHEAVIRAGAVRARPIVLTALAAMLGAFFILDDPIFNGLAISLIFGILVSTLLTLVVIPVMYYAFMHKRFSA
jgi:multidrug efflux pump subunit AcrB